MRPMGVTGLGARGTNTWRGSRGCLAGHLPAIHGAYGASGTKGYSIAAVTLSTGSLYVLRRRNSRLPLAKAQRR